MGNQEQQESKEKKAGEGIEISPEAAKSREAVLEKLEEKRDEMIDEVTETFDKKISYGGTQMDERGKHRMILMRDRQITEIRKMYAELIEEFDRRIKQDSTVNLENLANELLQTTASKTRQRLDKLKVILAKKVEGTYMTTPEAAAVEKAVNGMELFEKEHPELHALFVKLGEGGALTDDDYQKIIAIMNPSDLMKAGSGSEQAIESSSAGLLISMMSSAQRYELIVKFMESDKKQSAGELIDAFLKTGIITKYQGEELFREALSKGAVSAEKYESTYKERIESDYYEQEFNKFKQAVQTETGSRYSGDFSRNVVDRFVGKPLLHSILMLWGGVTAFVNILASRDKESLANTLKNIASNEYFWLGTAAAGVGLEGATGSMHEHAPRGGVLDFLGLGQGVVSKWIDNLLDDEDKNDVTKRNAVKVLGEAYLSSPPALRSYLENGGNNTIMAVKEEKNEKGEVSITLDKVIAKEGNAEQKSRLEGLKAMNARADKPVDRVLFAVAAAGEALEIDEKKTNLADALKKIRDTQKPSES